MLEAEVRMLRASLEETVSNFNSALAALATQRTAAAAEVSAPSFCSPSLGCMPCVITDLIC